ncbi:MAG: NAD(P)H-binding protein [Saprospiraceae bacterium]|nr:NAD(P)H-binding protein [Saprospiraceae bacterium]
MTSNILLIGGSGKTGRKVVEGLKQQHQNVRLGIRNNVPAFDWDKPATWPNALAGMDKVYIVYYPDLAVPGAFEAIKSLTEEAKKAGVQKVVLLSGKGEKEAERCEQVVANSGMDYTLIRASWFNQNFSESFLLEPILAGHVALPMSNAKIPFVDTTDIADVVVKVLLDDFHNGKTYEITGPRALTFKEVVMEIAKGTGRSIHYEAVSLGKYKSMMSAAGLPDDYIWLFDYLFREVLGKEENQAITNDVEKVLGRKATDFREFVQYTTRKGIWHQGIPQSI